MKSMQKIQLIQLTYEQQKRVAKYFDRLTYVTKVAMEEAQSADEHLVHEKLEIYRKLQKRRLDILSAFKILGIELQIEEPQQPTELQQIRMMFTKMK